MDDVVQNTGKWNQLFCVTSEVVFFCDHHPLIHIVNILNALFLLFHLLDRHTGIYFCTAIL